MPGVGFHSVPHFSRGRGQQVNGIVIHQFAGGTVAAVQNWLRNPASQVSYHFGVGRNGEIRQWVDTADTAWATGPVNGRTIAIGHEATNQPLTASQLAATARVIRWARGAHRSIPGGRNGLSGHRNWMQTNCPGNPIMGQLDELQRASTGAAPAPTPPPPPRPPPPPPQQEQAMIVTDSMWGTGSDGDGVITLVVPSRATHLRLGTSVNARLALDWGPGVRTDTVDLTFANRIDRPLPANHNGKVIVRRRSGGAMPIDLVWLVS
jgi:hypothetical protein